MKVSNYLEVKVSKDHIANGTKGNCFDCPICYAIIDASAKSKRESNYLYRKVSVDQSIMLNDIFGGMYACNSIAIPKEMVQWIVSYDKGEKVSECSFSLHQTSCYPNVPEVEIVNFKISNQ
jgi:hypothetical protein